MQGVEGEGRGRSTGANPPRETRSCEEFEVRCFYEIMMYDRPAGQPASPGGFIVVMIQCRNLGLIDEVRTVSGGMSALLRGDDSPAGIFS